MNSLIERKYNLILSLLEEHQSILVLGPRATGKTFFLSRILKNKTNFLQINLLNNSEFERYVSYPERLYSEVVNKLETLDSPLFVMIDEIQRIPKLLNEVHRTLEDFKNKVIFILTGSSARKLKRDENSNLLAGRAISINFFPLSSTEIDFYKNLEKIIVFGTLPEIFLLESNNIKIEKLRTYVGTYLSEEIQRESEIRRIDNFSRFLEIAASINGSGVNFSKLSRAIGVSPPTIKDYYSILKDTLIVYEVPAWTYSIKKQIQQSSKYYFFDNGVLNAILGELSSKAKSSTYHYGKLFENLVVTEIIRLCDIKRYPIKIFNYKTTTNQEIDLILQKNANSKIVAIEIKSNENPKLEDVSALSIFASDYPDATCIVLCKTPRSYVEGNIKFLPFIEGINLALETASSPD